jgi:organic hydroperoxide reductase OsmC/OhrA
MKCGRMRGNKREATIWTAHTVTVNSLIESNNQTNKQTNIKHPGTWKVCPYSQKISQKVALGVSLSTTTMTVSVAVGLAKAG